MNRAPYRRVTPPRHSAGEYHREDEYNNETAISHAETLIMQCIICGVIMVFVLIASMTNIGPAAGARDGIRQVLSGPVTLDELITEVRQFGMNWLELQPVETITNPEEFYFPTISSPDETPDFSLEQTSHEYTDYPPAADYPESNQTVPEPLVTPGLWD